MAMFVLVLVTMRHVTLSDDVGAKWWTGCPSTSRIVSPGRRPAAQAGAGLPFASVGTTQPTVVVLSASVEGLPTLQTTTAKPSASRKLNSGPANATMILSSGETLGSFSASASTLDRKSTRL